ncbi:MAG: RNA polymerase sigma factor [Saprospiraceae bacterium]|nr:RNA polymerase sigma factor [Saprospiraceae bacterium]
MSQSPNISIIVEGCIAGDRLYQKQLYELCHVRVMSVCMRYCSNYEEARDLFQESFIRIFSNLNSFKSEQGDLLAWVYTISRNVVFTHLSKQKFSFTELNDQYIDYKEDSQNEIISGQFSAIEKEIKQMPEGYRTILNLFVFEELSHDEIANILNISPSTSRSQLVRAREYLKKKLLPKPVSIKVN